MSPVNSLDEDFLRFMSGHILQGLISGALLLRKPLAFLSLRCLQNRSGRFKVLLRSKITSDLSGSTLLFISF